MKHAECGRHYCTIFESDDIIRHFDTQGGYDDSHLIIEVCGPSKILAFSLDLDDMFSGQDLAGLKNLQSDRAAGWIGFDVFGYRIRRAFKATNRVKRASKKSRSVHLKLKYSLKIDFMQLFPQIHRLLKRKN